ncbi:gamma-aminobutyric acid type B receptor subunit 2-like [Dysidea avara]|uniref:gamma-aminobutyric acid type B receptor subunit 2-like n=1 Tax=Dysidea avara TaxID=196820 RepID=UPI00331C8DE0
MRNFTFALERPLLLVTILGLYLCQGSCRNNNGASSGTTAALPVLRVLGLFPYGESSLWNGEYVIPAARLARDEVNRNNSVLPGYRLELMEADSGCARDSGVREFVRNAIHSDHPQPVAILGAGCSSSTIPIASIAGRDDIRLPQLSYGATSPFLSLTSSYPYFYRTVPTDESTSLAIISLVKRFKWKRYGIHNAAIGTILNEVAVTTLRIGIQFHIKDSKEVYFGGTNRDMGSFEDQRAFREDIHSSGMRIGMLYGVRGFIGQMICYLYQHKLTYPNVVWIVQNNRGNWYNTSTDNCTVEEIHQATHGMIHFNYPLRTSYDNDIIDVTNKTFEQYYQSYIKESEKYASEKREIYNDSLLNSWATIAYDSMWTLGLALHKAEEILSQFNSTLANFSLGNQNISKTIIEELSKIKFAGASGNVSFDEAHKRPFTITIDQVQNGVLKRIGLYHPSRNNSMLGVLDLNDSVLLWSANNPPSDVFVTELLLAQRWAGILMLVFLVIGFLWNGFSLLVNFRYQSFYSIKASSPQLNYVIFSGNNLLLLGGILLVVRTIAEHDMVIFSTLCETTQWLFDLGLLLVLNTTLLKSWRLYRIFHSFRRTPGKLISDNSFIAISIGWIFINTMYHVVFTLAHNNNIAKEKLLLVEGQYRQKVVYCLPPNLIGLFYVPHFLMAVMLCLLVFLIRRVYPKHSNSTGIVYKHFNDAKNITIFFYATVPIATICITLSRLLSPTNEVYNMETASLILDCSTVCCIVFMCQWTLFMPKMLPVFRHLYSHR